ncbi:MAG: hypothetical protein NVS9B11_15280 [Candidatus Dormibacteraceae bacterium]
MLAPSSTYVPADNPACAGAPRRLVRLLTIPNGRRCLRAARSCDHQRGQWRPHACAWRDHSTSHHRNGMTIFDIAAEGGWKDSEMVRRYTHDRPFEELQAMPTALTAMLRRRAS